MDNWEGFDCKCAGCGEVFKARAAHARWCSPACKNRAYRLRNGLNKTGRRWKKRETVNASHK